MIAKETKIAEGTTIAKETKEFFMFSYFKVVPEEVFDAKKEKDEYSKHSNYKSYIAYRCAYRAYLDVCRSIKYSVKSTDIEKDKKKYAGYTDLKNTFIDYEIYCVLSSIQEIRGINNCVEFKEWHNSICDGKMRMTNDGIKDILNNDKIISKINYIKKETLSNALSALDNYPLFEKNFTYGFTYEFTYGMAQKLLNMTIKNILLVEDMCGTIFDFSLKDKIKLFHAPVDKNILKAAKKLGVEGFGIDGWSNWDKEKYNKFTEKLNEIIINKYQYPLQWEHISWIENAE